MTLLILLILYAGRHFGMEWEIMADSWVDVIGFLMLFVLTIAGDFKRAFK